MSTKVTQNIDQEGAGLAQLAGKYLTFNLGHEEYGLQILRVREIMGLMEITPVPRTPEFVLGVVNLRGKVIPVVDLRLKFDLPSREFDERTCIIVLEVQIEGEPRSMGVVVDSVNEVSDIKAQNLEPTPSFGVDLDTSFILGMAKISDSVKTLLDVDQVLTGTEMAALGAM